MVATNFFTTTTFHAPPLARQTKHLGVKIFWWFITVAGICLTGWTSWKLMQELFANSLVTTVSVVETDVVKIPNITICSMRRINRTALLETGYWQADPNLHLKLLMLYYNPYSTSLYSVDGLNFTKEFYDVQYTKQFLYDLLLNVTFDCTSFLSKFCKLESDAMAPNCTHHGRCFHSHNGPCFAFETQELFQRTPSAIGGLELFTTEPPVEDILSDTVFNTFTEDGMQLFTAVEDSIIERSPVLIPYKTRTKISLYSSHTKLLPEREDGCLRKENNIPTKFFETYSSRRCQIECMLATVKELCGCYMFMTFLKIEAKDMCDPLQLFRCFGLNETAKLEMHEELANCRYDECIDTCDHWRDTASISSSEYMTDVYRESFYKQYPHFEDVSFGTIQIYYNDIQYQKVTEAKAVTFTTFLANIGGNLCLYTGASMVSLVHLAYCLIKLGLKYVQKPAVNEDVIPEQDISIPVQQTMQQTPNVPVAKSSAAAAYDSTLRKTFFMDSKSLSLYKFQIPRPKVSL